MILTFTPNPCVDKTIYVETFAPGMRLRSDRCTCIAGGKGTNVSRVAKALGHPTTAMNVVGGPAGEHVVQMMERDDGITCVPCRVESMTRTITTVLEESTGRQTAFFEPGSKVTAEEADSVRRVFTEQISNASLLTLNGTVPDETMSSLYHDFILQAKKVGIPVILDSHGPEFLEGLKASPDVVKPNLEEAAEAVGYALEDEASQWRAVDWFHEQGVGTVVLSRGAQGLLISSKSERLRLTPPSIREVNPVGSGDALVAGIAIGLLGGWTLEELARYGAALGAANAQSWDIGQFDLDAIPGLRDACKVDQVQATT